LLLFAGLFGKLEIMLALKASLFPLHWDWYATCVLFFVIGQVFRMRRTRSCCWRECLVCRGVHQRRMRWPEPPGPPVQESRSVMMKTLNNSLLELLKWPRMSVPRQLGGGVCRFENLCWRLVVAGDMSPVKYCNSGQVVVLLSNRSPLAVACCWLASLACFVAVFSFRLNLGWPDSVLLSCDNGTRLVWGVWKKIYYLPITCC
jgi:hypothetical protein